MTEVDDKPRALADWKPPKRFARGWHCLGLADSFRDGKPHTVEAFGTKLVIWADTKGQLNVLDSYCRHLGGDLSDGEIKGDNIACPFHDWRWGGDGRCKEIPYSKRVPLRARTKKWHTCEVNRQLFVWHDVEGNPPIEKQAIPEIPELEKYSNFTWKSILVEGSHCMEIVDNTVDMAHFFYIHFAYPTYFKNVFDDHVATQYMSSKSRQDVYSSIKYNLDDAVLHSDAAYYGPSYMIDYLVNDFGGYKIESVLINCHLPISDNSFLLQYGVAVKQPEGMSEEQTAKIAGKFSDNFEEGFLQDVAIWQSKAPIANPLLCEEDGPVYQLRRWYSQFYTDIADVQSEMTDRFEFEVDTTKANEYWQSEVAKNLRQREQEEAGDTAEVGG